MRATRIESETEYWCKAITYWTEMEERYFLMNDREGEARCQERIYRCELAFQEAQGLIEVYTGRSTPDFRAFKQLPARYGA